MSYPLTSLLTDGSRYQKCYHQFMKDSTEHQSMQDFIDNQLPGILESTINGKSHLNVIGVGSASGELDLKMLSALHLKNPNMIVDNEVVEPFRQHIDQYKDLVSKTPGLDYIHFDWNQMTAEEFEEHWKEKKMTKKADFIHMLQMLYYVKDRGTTISFYKSLLNKNGKLLISVLTGDNGWEKLDKTYAKELCDSEKHCVYSDDIKKLLDSMGVSYKGYAAPSQEDITKCFIEGNEEGEQLLDFLTEVVQFSKSASPELKAGVMELLRQSSVETNGQVMLNTNIEMIVIDHLT